MVIGYARDMPAYKVYDFETHKRREVSFTMTYIHEGYYPYLQAQKEKLAQEMKEDPHTFFPTREAALDPDEWKTYDYSPADDRAAWANKETWLRSLSKDSAIDYTPWWVAITDARDQTTSHSSSRNLSRLGGCHA